MSTKTTTSSYMQDEDNLRVSRTTKEAQTAGENISDVELVEELQFLSSLLHYVAAARRLYVKSYRFIAYLFVLLVVCWLSLSTMQLFDQLASHHHAISRIGAALTKMTDDIAL